MQSAENETETERLRAVRSLRVSQGDRIERVPGLHAIVRAAAHACGAELAAVALVEETELLALAAHGLDVSRLPRAGSLCAHSMLAGDVFEVPDARADPRFADAAPVTEAPHVRFYAAAPLVDGRGMRLGALCVFDPLPSRLTDDQRAQLRTLADAVVDILEARAGEASREQLARQDRLVTAGTLAAGVGHEINNPLSFVATNLDYAVDELRAIGAAHPSLSPTLDEVVTAISEAKDGANRIRKIVRGLQSFAHQDTPKAPTSVESALDAATGLALHEVRHAATLDVVVEFVPPVLADEAGLTHVVVNLLVNAAQAFEKQDASVNKVELRAFRHNDAEVAITVSDNGPGITAEVLPRIFDPFFTTKPVGHGSGLGLSLCHTIVSSLGGELTCETELGRGTKFTVILPVANVVLRASELPSSGTTPVARGRILLIDDEEGLLRAMTRLLRQDHEVVAIADPRAALSMLVDSNAAFDLVFCDLMMPHLTGMELFRTVEKRRPSMSARFVFMTAGAMSDDASTFLANSRNPRVDKPFSSEALRSLAQKLVQKFGSQASAVSARSSAGTD